MLHLDLTSFCSILLFTLGFAEGGGIQAELASVDKVYWEYLCLVWEVFLNFFFESPSSPRALHSTLLFLLEHYLGYSLK